MEQWARPAQLLDPARALCHLQHEKDVAPASSAGEDKPSPGALVTAGAGVAAPWHAVQHGSGLLRRGEAVPQQPCCRICTSLGCGHPLSPHRTMWHCRTLGRSATLWALPLPEHRDRDLGCAGLGLGASSC